MASGTRETKKALASLSILSCRGVRAPFDPCGFLSLSKTLCFVSCMQRDMIYPHIASHDAQHGTNALFVRNMTDACYKFSTWHKAAAPQPAKPALPQPAKVCSCQTVDESGAFSFPRF